MSSIKCPNCSTQVASTALFCYNCGQRVKCEVCNSLILKGAKFCSNCGTSVSSNPNNQSNKNTVKYHRTKDELSCEVSLSDEVGKEGIKELIQNLTNNQNQNYKLLRESKDNDNDEVNDIEDAEEIEDVTIKPKRTDEPAENEFPHISDVEMTVDCSEAEWIAIYALYQSDFGKKTFSKKAVYDRYMLKRKNDSHVANFSKNWKGLFKSYFSTVNDNELKFKAGSFQYLKNIITGVEKGTQKNAGTKKKVNKPNAQNGEVLVSDNTAPGSKHRTKMSSAESYVLDHDLNLYPKDKQSLKEFFGQYAAESSPEVILIIVYYVQKILGLSNINANTIYTCYKHIGLPVPVISDALNNVRRRKGWVNISNKSDLKITVSGENEIEHVMKKKEK